MKVSELIKELETLRDERGDLIVKASVEYSDNGIVNRITSGKYNKKRMNTIMGELSKGNLELNYSGDEMKILLSSLHLFAAYGYEGVAVGTIAKMAQVKLSAINALGGKKELLKSCYRYYLTHRHTTRLTKDQYISILEKGSKEEVADILVYRFPDDTAQNIFECLSIVMARLYIDEMAREIYIDDFEQAMDYMRDLFTLGIKIGRFEEFDIEVISHLYLSFRLYGLQLAIVKHSNLDRWSEVEANIFCKIRGLIPFKY